MSAVLPVDQVLRRGQRIQQAQELRVAGHRQHDGRHHGQQQMHDRPGERDEQMDLRLIRHARRNQSADRTEHDRVDFSADANRRQRMAHFVQRDAHQQNADHQQAGAHEFWIRQRERQRQQRGQQKEDVQIDGDAPPTAQAQTPALDRAPGHATSRTGKRISWPKSISAAVASTANRQPRRPNVSYQPRQTWANVSTQLRSGTCK